MKKLSRSKAQEPRLCPDCPLLSFLPTIMAERVSYTKEKEPLTSHKICQLLRAFAKDHHIIFQGCPYFPKTETMERYLYAEASTETR